MKTQVVVYEEGPYLLRGTFQLVTPEGQTVSERRVIALCGCGRSRMAPFCDGSHKLGRSRDVRLHPDLARVRQTSELPPAPGPAKS